MGPKRENKLRYQKFREIEISRKKTFNEAATLIYKNIVSSPLVLLLIIIIILLLKKKFIYYHGKKQQYHLILPSSSTTGQKIKKSPRKKLVKLNKSQLFS